MKLLNTTLLACAWIASAAFAQTQQIGAPTSLSNEPVLKYRDPAQPLTIGEMSDIQAAEETEKFLKKHGFTGAKPEDPNPSANGAAGQADVPEPPPNQVKLLAIFGQPSQLTAEVAINQVVYQVDRPTAIGPVQFAALGKDVVQIVLPRKPGCKPKKARPCATTAHRMAVGDIVEWR